MCKKHFLAYLKVIVRKEFRLVYRDPESTYAALDFSGKGKIQMKDILDNLVFKRLKFVKEDVILWMLRDKVFDDINSTIDFERFKRHFFPHLLLIKDNEEEEIDDKQKADADIINKSRSLLEKVNKQEVVH